MAKRIPNICQVYGCREPPITPAYPVYLGSEPALYICKGHYEMMYLPVIGTIDILTAEFGEVDWLDGEG